MVIVHELAHVMMSNRIDSRLTDFVAQAMEESLANAITLKYFFENDRDNYDKVYAFIK